ncbi:MAG TPA: CPBP family intramembrane glutamic endopeptidase [Anaerolineales bacterium]
MNASNDMRKAWQKTRWVQALAIVLGYTLPLLVFISQVYEVDFGFITRLDEAGSAEGYLFYAMVYTLFVIAVLLLLLRFLCGEKLNALNLKPGTWWKDLLWGVVLVGLTLSIKYTLDPIIAQYSYRASDSESGLGNLFYTLAGNPWLLVLFLGPVLFVGVAGSEELTRMFFITRWKNISNSTLWMGVGVFLSAILFGLNHVQQGPAGILSVSLNGLIMVLWYLRFGRIFHLIVAHYLYDAVQIVFIVFLIWNEVI